MKLEAGELELTYCSRMETFLAVIVLEVVALLDQVSAEVVAAYSALTIALHHWEWETGFLSSSGQYKPLQLLQRMYLLMYQDWRIPTLKMWIMREGMSPRLEQRQDLALNLWTRIQVRRYHSGDQELGELSGTDQLQELSPTILDTGLENCQCQYC